MTPEQQTVVKDRMTYMDAQPIGLRPVNDYLVVALGHGNLILNVTAKQILELSDEGVDMVIKMVKADLRAKRTGIYSDFRVIDGLPSAFFEYLPLPYPVETFRYKRLWMAILYLWIGTITLTIAFAALTL